MKNGQFAFLLFFLGMISLFAAAQPPSGNTSILGDSGRGVLLMKAFMDEFNVLVSAAGGAEVVMAKHYRKQSSHAI